MRPHLLILVGALIIVFRGDLSAQIQVFSNPDSCDLFYTTSSHRFPPLQSDMPYDVMISWIVLDSLCKTSTYDQVYERAKATSLDSLKLALRYYYKIQNHDPLLLAHYDREILQLRTPNSPSPIQNALETAYEERFGKIPDNIKAFWYADRIFHVYVMNQVSYLKRYPQHGDTLEVFCADLNIIDKIKGQKIYPICHDLPGIRIFGDNSDSSSCIRVEWTRKVSQVRMNEKDSLWYKEKGPNRYAIGKEYIVLLQHQSNKIYVNTISWATTSTLSNISNYPIKSWHFLIENGKVQDALNLLGFGTDVPIQDFKTMIINSINNFLGM